MNNPIVYTCTGRIKQDYRPEMHNMPQESINTFVSKRRNSDRTVATATAALNAEYARRAANVGLSLAEYKRRFNIK